MQNNAATACAVAMLLFASLCGACSPTTSRPTAGDEGGSSTPATTAGVLERATCDFKVGDAATKRGGNSRIAAPDIGAQALEAPVGVREEWNDDIGEFVNPDTGEVVTLVVVPTHVITGNGGIELGSEHTDANGTYQQVRIPQSAEVISGLDAWPRAYGDVKESWTRQDFYTAQDFAVCFILTWFLDNPAVADRTPAQLEAYAREAEELVPPAYRDEWALAVTDVHDANHTSPMGPLSPVAQGREIAKYAPGAPRYDLKHLRIRQVALSESGESLHFEISVGANYPAITISREEAGDPRARADHVISVGVTLIDGVPYLVALT